MIKRFVVIFLLLIPFAVIAEETNLEDKVKEIEKRLETLESLLLNNPFLSMMDTSPQVDFLQKSATTSDSQLRNKKKQYIKDNLLIYDLVARKIDTLLDGEDVPAVSFKLKNNGNKTLTRVKITIYFKDVNGFNIYEKDFIPIQVSEYAMLGSNDNKPLKPKYIWELEKDKIYYVKTVPSEWAGEVEAKITDIDFAASEIGEHMLDESSTQSTNNKSIPDITNSPVDESYSKMVFERIQREWIYPDFDIAQLETIISFKITKDGTVMSQIVKKSSGNAIFDRSAMKAVLKASPLPPPPVEQKVEIRFHL